MLARPEGFWIAEQYLALRAEIRPSYESDESGLAEEYVQRRSRWRSDPTPHPTIGDFVSLKSGIRDATFREPARPDLPFWLGLFRKFLSSPNLPAPVRQRARYELVVASLRGAGDMRPVDDVTRQFLRDALTETEPVRLQDAAVLLQYAIGAAGHAVTTMRPGELRRWNRRIRERVQELLTDSSPHRRAVLLDVLGLLGMQRAVSEQQLADARANWEDAPPANAILSEFSLPLGIELTEDDFIDLPSAVAAWTELAMALEDTPLFPVDHLSRMLGIFAPALIDMPEWRNLVDLVDHAVERTSGKAAVAARARDRALALMRANRPIDALEEFHKAKLDWWSGDTLRGSLLTMLMIAKLYLEVRLPLAAKSHALSAAGIAAAHHDGEHADLVAQGLRMAASADMMSGAWCGATELYGRAIAVRYVVSESRLDAESVDWFAEPDLHLAYVTACAGAIDEELLQSVQAITTPVGVHDVVEMVLDDAAPDNERQWASFGAEELTGPPLLGSGNRKVHPLLGVGHRLGIVSGQ